jgi:hypothetical protein
MGIIIAMESTYRHKHDYPKLRKLIGEESFGINIPRYKDGERLTGSLPLLQVVENKLGIEAFPVRQYILYDPGFDQVIRWGTILGISLVCPLFGAFIYRRVTKKPGVPYGKIVLFYTLGVGMVFSSSQFFVQGLNTLVCEDDVIASHEKVGAELENVLPAGSTVFWDVKSDMLLLDLPDVQVFLPQLNFRFTLVNDPLADWDQLEKFGWWNMELGEEWITQADYISVEQRFFADLWQWDQRVERGEFEVIFTSSNPESCRAEISNVVVLKRVDED